MKQKARALWPTKTRHMGRVLMTSYKKIELGKPAMEFNRSHRTVSWYGQALLSTFVTLVEIKSTENVFCSFTG